MPNVIRNRKIWIGGSWLISMVVVVAVLAFGEFGAPSWIFILCGVWLLSIGLPTTVSVLALAGIWGRIPGMGTPPLSVFAACVALLSLFAQAVSFHAIIRVSNRWRKS